MSSLHWTEAKLFKFLRLYKRYECLWNPYSSEYENCDAKSEAFSQILYEMNIFGLTVNECLNQIKHIRETYKQEQQRLENLAFLGGRGYSNLLWYPLMNSMLSKVIQDEDKLNRAAGNSDLVVIPKRLQLNSGDQLGNQRDSIRSGFRQRTISWSHNGTTTICPYIPNSNFGDYMNCYQNPNILNNNCIGTFEPNEHISSCPTCGYSSSCSCNCFSMNNIGYNSDNVAQGYNSSGSQINYRPRTSYNYRNGILEINSAVRIPVPHPLPNYGYSNLIESITPEEPEYNFNTISSDHQPEVQTAVKEEEEFPTECCEISPNDKDRENKVSGHCESQKIIDQAALSNSNPSNLPIDKNDLVTENINWSLKRSKREKGNANEILCAQDLFGLIGIAQDSICKSLKHENTGTDNNKASQSIDQKDQANDIQHSPKFEFENSFDIKQKIVTLNPQKQSNVNVRAEKALKSNMNMTEENVKVEQNSTMALKNEQPTKGRILTAKCSQLKNVQTNCKSDSKGLRKIKTTDVSIQSLLDVINDSNEKISDLETSQNLVQKSKSIIKRNLTKFVIDFIDETLNKPDKISTINTEERLILKKVAKDLKALRNKSNRISNGKLATEDYQQPQQNRKIKFCNKTICWREPVEESLNIVPCKSTRFPTHKINNNKNILAGRPMQLNKGTGHRFRMMAGADIDIDNDIQRSNLFSQKDTQLKNKATTTDYSAFDDNEKTRHEHFTSANCQEHLIISMYRKQQCNDENDTQTMADIIESEASQIKPEEYVLTDVKSVQVTNEVALSDSNSNVARPKNLKVSPPDKNQKKERSLIIDKLFQTGESIDLDSQNVEKGGRIITMENNLNTKICEDQIDHFKRKPSSDLQDSKIENSVTIHVSVETSESTENEVLDKVVNKITHVLRKTLDENGFAIEKKQFFTKKNLITNDNGEIHRKLIECEAVWKTELRNIIRHLMKQKKIGDPITFKVKTMILPVTNQSNDAAAKETINLTSSTKPRQKFDTSQKEKEIGIHKTDTNLQIKKAQYEISRDTHQIFLKNKGKLYDEGDNQHTKIMEDSESDFKPNRMARKSRPRNKHIIPKSILKNVTRLDKILFDDLNRIISPYKDYPHSLSKLLKYLVQFRKVFQSIPKKCEKSLRNELQGNKYAIMNNKKFDQNHQKSDFVAVNFCDKLPCNLNADIDVYLCTEISEEDQSPMEKQTECHSLSDSSICNDINKNSLSTSTSAIQENSQMKKSTNSCVQKIESKSKQDVGEWESFSDSEDEAEVFKHCRHRNNSSRHISKRQSEKKTVYTLTRATKNTIWYPKYVKKVVERPDTVNQLTNKFYSTSSEINGLKNIPSFQNNFKIIDIFSSNKQNISQNELRSSEEGSKASSCCADFEGMQKAKTYRIPKPSESEEGQSLLEAKLRSAADNQIKSCCTYDKAGNVCTRICDVTSRLRLCALLKSPNESSTANHDVPSNNICCCDDMDKSNNADPAYSKLRIKPTKKNVMVGEASVRLITESCQTEFFEGDLNTLDPQSHASSQDYKRALNSSFQTACDGTYRKNSTVINSTIITTNKNIEQPDNVDHLKSTTIKQATVQSNTRNSVPTSLDIPDFEDESLILEIRMLQPLFSIELKKKGYKDSVKTVKQTSYELLEKNNHHIVVSSPQDPVVIESSSKNGLISPEQQNINCFNESTSINSMNCRGQTIVDQEAESPIQKCKEEVLSTETEGIQICKMANDSEKRNKVSSDDSTSSTSTTCNELKHNASTSLEGNRDCLDPDQCNILLETLESLKTYEDPCEISNNEVSALNSVTCAEEAISKLTENSSDETQSRTIKSLISTVETSLQHITDPLIHQKLIDVIKCIRNQDENENYSSTDIYSENQTCGTVKNTLTENEMEVQIKSEEDIEPLQSVLLITKQTECQKSCAPESAVISNDSRNTEKILSVVEISQDENEKSQSKGAARTSQTKVQSPADHRLPKKEVAVQILTNGSRVRFSQAGKCYYRSKPRLILREEAISLCDEACSGEACSGEIGARKKARSEAPLSKSISKLQMLKIEKNIFASEKGLTELEENSHLMSTFNYSSNDISCDIEEVESDTSRCDPNIKERLNTVPLLQNDENYGSSKYNFFHTEVEINAFANMVASQLRGLSTEAALRSQQRIQTLISNSRLEWEKNKQYR